MALAYSWPPTVSWFPTKDLVSYSAAFCQLKDVSSSELRTSLVIGVFRLPADNSETASQFVRDKRKLEIWGKAQRESARRPKSDWGKLEGEG